MKDLFFHKNLTHISSISWKRILDQWQKSETDQTNKKQWKSIYQAEGFNSWLDWRSSYFEPLGLSSKKWQLFECTSPQEFIPKCTIGPFERWKTFYTGKKPSFGELVQNPDVQKYPKILSIAKNFPLETQIIVLFDGKDYTIFEGTHRASAYCLLLQNNKAPKTKFLVALASHQWHNGE